MTDTKVCACCKNALPATREFFERDGAALRSRCHKCRYARRKARHAAIPELLERRRDCVKRWRRANPHYRPSGQGLQRAKEKAAEWRRNNLELFRKIRRESYHRLRAQSPVHVIRARMKKSMLASLKRGPKSKRWEEIAGYSAVQLKEHLERQFTKGMSWENYGPFGWHIDHIIPIAAFKIDKPGDDEFRACWALSNLRPLWRKDNLAKGCEVTHLL